MFIATICFSFVNVILSVLNTIPAHQIIFIRSGFNIIYTFSILKYFKIEKIGKNVPFLILRGFTGFFAFLTFTITLHHLSLATGTTLQYLSPIFTALFGQVINNEKVTKSEMICYLIAFSGIIIIKGFSIGDDNFYYILGILSAVLSGIAYNWIRILKNTEDSNTVIFYFFTVSFICSIPLCVYNSVNLTINEFGLIFIMSILTQIAQSFMTKAYQSAPLVQVSIIFYLGIIYSVANGYFFFNQTISLQTSLGILLVLAGVFLSLFSKNK